MPEKVESPRESHEDAGKSTVKPKKRDRVAEAMAMREAALDLAALQFKALGDPTRLRIVRLLSGDLRLGVPADEEAITDDASVRDGWTVGDVSVRLFGKSKVSSTLSHHLKELRNAQLITMKRRGKNLICRIQEREIADLRCHLAIRSLVRASVSAKEPSLREGEARDDAGNRNDTPGI